MKILEPESESELSLSRQLFIDKACLQFEDRWHSSDVLRIEDLMAEADDTVWLPLLVELLRLEWGLLRKNGQRPRLTNYLRRFPENAPEIESIWNLDIRELKLGDPKAKASQEVARISHARMQPEKLHVRAIRAREELEVDILSLSSLQPMAAEHLTRRIQLVQRIDQHPAVRKVYSADFEGHGASAMLEMVPQRSLWELMDGNSSVSVRNKLSIGYQVASVLVSGHAIGLVHGDLKPSTIHIRSDESVLIDFFATAPTTNSKSVNFPEKDACFSAPEATAGTTEAVSDVFSFAALMTWMFRSDSNDPLGSPQLVRDQLEKHLPRNATTDSAIEALCDALERGRNTNPSQRCTVREIFQPLKEIAGQLGIDTSEIKDDLVNSRAISMDFELQLPSNQSPSNSIRGGAAPGPQSRLGRYRILEKLGEGGMGEVYRAVEMTSNETVAIKILKPIMVRDSESLKRFWKEARLLGEINSPHVVRLFEIKEHEGVHYIVMEYLDGVDLRSLIKQVAPMPELTALKILRDAARGLAEAHRRGIIHRDIKPENILLNSEGAIQILNGGTPVLSDPNHDSQESENWQVKLTDFGLARQIDQSESMRLTLSGIVVGTIAYMPPEMFEEQIEIRPAADVYALGATLFEMLTGLRPYPADNLMQLAKLHSTTSLPDVRSFNSTVSSKTAKFVRRSLAKKPTKRFADADQLLEAVESLLAKIL